MQTLRILKLALLALAALGTAQAANETKRKGDFTDHIGEDPQPLQTGTMQWPEAEFAEASVRGRAFKPGEKFTFNAHWGIFRKAGQMVIETEIMQREDGEKLLIKTETASKGFIRTLYPMTLQAETLIDTDHWRMDTNTVNGKTRSTLSETKTTFDYNAGAMNYFDANNPEKCGTKPLPYPYPLDYAGALLQARGWDLKEGESYPLLISSKGKFYFIEMAISGKEEINTRFGRMEALRIEPVNAYPQSRIFREGGKFAMWISADSKRIPLRFDLSTSIGTASMRLRDYQLQGEVLVARK